MVGRDHSDVIRCKADSQLTCVDTSKLQSTPYSTKWTFHILMTMASQSSAW
jgi:hypothetical protein